MNAAQTLAARVDEELNVWRLLGSLSLAFGVSALLLAAIGVYGVTAFGVQRRTREFGLRMAVGATRGDVLRLVFKHGVQRLALGMIAGVFLGWAISRPLAHLAARITGPPGAVVYLMVLSAMAVALGVALWLPARRAANVDPMEALRYE